jgi:hypothetical protein
LHHLHRDNISTGGGGGTPAGQRRIKNNSAKVSCQFPSKGLNIPNGEYDCLYCTYCVTSEADMNLDFLVTGAAQGLGFEFTR